MCFETDMLRCEEVSASDLRQKDWMHNYDQQFFRIMQAPRLDISVAV